MKKRLKLWIQALRSGKYEQTTGIMHEVVRDKHKYCVLGIGQLVMNKLMKKNSHTDRTMDAVTGFFGLPSCEEIYEKNDSPNNWSFSRIADYLEQTYLTKSPSRARV